MMNFKDSRITYTDISSPFEHLSDIGSPRVDGLPMVPQDPYVQAALQAPPSSDYVSGPEHPPSPDYVPKFIPKPPVYPEFMPAEDDILLVEEQPLPHPLLRDEGDDEDESFGDEEDDVNIKEDKEKGEHLAPADSTPVALPTIDHAPSAEETEPFETDESAATPPPHPAYRVTARIADVREVFLPPWKRLCYALGSRFEVGESSSAPTVRRARDSRPHYKFIATLDDEIMRDLERDVGYGITDSWDEIVDTMQRAPAIDETELGRRVTNLVETMFNTPKFGRSGIRVR
nr:hypothetical protein [Tanacetum cinerariifolium]